VVRCGEVSFGMAGSGKVRSGKLRRVALRWGEVWIMLSYLWRYGAVRHGKSWHGLVPRVGVRSVMVIRGGVATLSRHFFFLRYTL